MCTVTGERQMFLLLPLVALAAQAAQGMPAPDQGRALGWLWSSPLAQYPQVNRAGLVGGSYVEPQQEILREEGRRRYDNEKLVKKKNSKSEVVGTGSFKLEVDEHDPTSHSIQVQAVHEEPLPVPTLQLVNFKKPETLAVPATPTVWGWFKDLIPAWGWNSPPTLATPQVSLSHLLPQISTSKPQVSLSDLTPQFSILKPQVSLSNLVPQFSAWIPTKAPSVEEHIIVPPAVKPVPVPTKSEVMVLRYPEFIKTIGRGISKVSSAMKKFGQEVTQNLANQFKLQSLPTKIGAGVAAIIPLKDETDVHHDSGIISKPTISIPKPVFSIPKPDFGSGLNLGSLFNKGSGVKVSGTASGSISVSKPGPQVPDKGGAKPSKTSIIVQSHV